MSVRSEELVLLLTRPRKNIVGEDCDWERKFEDSWLRTLDAFSPKPVSIVTFAEHPDFCGLKLYLEQRVILKLYAGEDLDDREHAIFEEWIVGDEEFGGSYFPPDIRDRISSVKDRGGGFREILLVIGRRGSKSLMTAIIGCYEIYKLLLKRDPHRYYHMLPGEPITVACCAATGEQALYAMFVKVKNLVLSNKWLRSRLTREGAQSTKILFKTDSDVKRDNEIYEQTGIRQDTSSVVITAFSAHSAAVRGRAAIVVIFDEQAWFQNSEGRDVGKDMYEALTPSTAGFGDDGRILSLSSPAYEFGFFYEQYDLVWKGGKRMALGIQLPSWEMYKRGDEVGMMPRFTLESLKNDDPMIPYGTDEWDREFAAKFQGSISQFLSPELVSRMFQNAKEIGWEWQDHGVGMNVYHCHGDPSKNGAAFPLGVVHFNEEDKRIYVDNLFRFFVKKAPSDIVGDHEKAYDMKTDISYDDVRDKCVDWSKGFFLDTISFDQFNSVMMIQQLRQRIAKDVGVQNPSARIYEETFTQQYNYDTYKLLRNCLNESIVVCPWYPILSKELNNLIDDKGRIDHPTAGPVQTKDVADVLAVLVRRAYESSITGRTNKTQGFHQLGAERPQFKFPLPVPVRGWM